MSKAASRENFSTPIYGFCVAINAIGYAMPHDAVIRVYDDAGNVIETHEHTGEFCEFRTIFSCLTPLACCD
jgi:hypothetical protein